VWLQRL
jgi:putative transposase